MKHYEPAYIPDEYDAVEKMCRLCRKQMSKIAFIGHIKSCEIEHVNDEK